MKNKKLVSSIFALCVLCTATACEKDSSKDISDTNSNISNTNSPHYSSEGNTENFEEVIEYISLTDIYDITFKGISPFLSINYTPKVIHVPIWEGQIGNDNNQKQIKLKIKGEEYEEAAKSDGSIYWTMTTETSFANKLKNGDKITLLPDEHATNYDIPGDGSLELGTYDDFENQKTIKYILKDNEITISGADEYVYKSEVLTQNAIDLFAADVTDTNFLYTFNSIGLIENYSGLVSSEDNMNVTIDKADIENVYLGTTPDNAKNNCLKLVYTVTITQGKKEPVSGYVVCKFSDPQVKNNVSECWSGIINSNAYKTIEEAVSAEITSSDEYDWIQVS